jgi:HlyD family secretion protein
MKHQIRKVVWLLLIVAVVVASVAWYSHRSNGSSVSYQAAKIERGSLLATITATGTVEPEEVVDVGAQVAGMVKTFGTDKDGREIDYGSVVDEGTVLAQIDDSLYMAQLAEATAQLQQTQASVQRSESDLKQMEARLYQAQRDWERAQKLGPSEALAQSSFDAYKSAYDIAKANIAVGQASILQAQASVAQAQAVLQRAQRNLSYCIIKSPVQGIIIDRRVNIGQTVVASLNAPSLFLIAKDLKRMQIWVSVNESDIGNIKPGQPVTFTVYAFPDQVFQGQVGKIRLNATMTQNVVNYVVEVNTDNSDGKLLPYLSADVRFELRRRDNVLMVPNVALRWFPAVEQVSPQFRDSEIVRNAENPEGPSPRPAAREPNLLAGADKRNQGVVWIPSGNYVKPLEVQVGSSDKIMTEISGNGIKEGLEVVIGEQSPRAENTSGSATTNPFTPQFRRR